MSLECAECERDLRGGHAISCSKYKLRTGIRELISDHLWGVEYDELPDANTQEKVDKLTTRCILTVMRYLDTHPKEGAA